MRKFVTRVPNFCLNERIMKASKKISPTRIYMYNRLFSPRIYRFFYILQRLEKDSKIDKIVLDCGAGGQYPSLSLFDTMGYETYGIDISEKQVKKANEFCNRHGLDLNIRVGDMRELPFEDEAFGLVYSYNSIFHLTKADSKKAMEEMRRVLKEPGYLYVNFLSVEDQQCGEGEKVGSGEWKSIEDGEPTIHSYYRDIEPDSYFEGMEVLLKEKRCTQFKTLDYQMVTLEYIAGKE